jgi:hypothetical protein
MVTKEIQKTKDGRKKQETISKRWKKETRNKSFLSLCVSCGPGV